MFVACKPRGPSSVSKVTAWPSSKVLNPSDKIKKISPVTAQTGPAVRYDENVMNKQLSLLKDDQLKEIYRLLSKNIHAFAINISHEQNKL